MARIFSLILLSVLLVLVPVAQAQDVPDDAVQKAIDKGVEFLWNAYTPGGGWGPYGPAGTFNFQPDGPSALAMYALLESGVKPQDERMTAALKWLQANRSDRTYSTGLRCQVWELAARENKDYMVDLRKDVATLIASTTTGAYSYPSTGTPGGAGYDNSNSQYGLLGVWAGARAHPPCEIPRDYWFRVMRHWMLDQDGKEGKWYYTDSVKKVEHGQGTMTVAGIASMFVCFDQLFYDRFIACESTSTEFKPIQLGLDWLEKNFTTLRDPRWYWYYLYGVERVGLASGYKYFGTTDWYKHGVEQILKAQAPNGAMGDVVNTSFALLFLIRGQRPVLFNKMQYEGDWNNRPRALASLTEWLNRTYEIQTNWQIINLKVPVREWHDAPILCFTGCREPKFSEEEIQKIRRFILEGGTLFASAEGTGTGFSTGMRMLYRKLFPHYELTPCKPGHELYNLYFKVNPLQAPMWEISNGIRPLIIHTDKDLTLTWQMRKIATQKFAYEAAANVYMYVTDKGMLRHRGTSLWPEGVTLNPAGAVKVARLKFAGRYDPEPLAFERFAMLMAKRHNQQVDVSEPMDITKLTNESAVAVLAGIGEVRLTPAEKEALKKYVAGGGYLLVTAAGGSPEFARTGKALIEELFPEKGPLQTLAGTAPLYAADFAPTMKIDTVKYRRKAKARLGPSTNTPVLRALLVEDKPILFFSQEDLVAGLVGYPSYNCDGYDPESAFAMMRNIVMFAAKNQAQSGAPAPAAPKPAATRAPAAPKPAATPTAPKPAVPPAPATPKPATK